MYLCDGSMAGGGRSKDNCSERAKAGLSGGPHGCSAGTVVMRVDHGARAITWEVPGGTITRTLFASHGEQEGAAGAEPYAGDLVPVVLLYTGDAATVRHAALAGVDGGQALPPPEAAAVGAAGGEGAAGAAPAAAGVASAPPPVPAAAAAAVAVAAAAPSGSSGGGVGSVSSSSSSSDDDDH